MLLKLAGARGSETSKIRKCQNVTVLLCCCTAFDLCVPICFLVSVLAQSAMSDQYRNLTAEQLRQELAERDARLTDRDARISDLQQTLDNERRAREELQNAVNYLHEQRVYVLMLERQQLHLCFATCAAQAHAFAGGM